ncbi:MAG: DUF4203 domain-containing protein [Coprothermobacterota bacterium]|nr:DUF4203 domain-containing protein [Coprothermobacterota bacterium]
MVEPIIRIVGGLLGIFVGRRLFWLFAAITGFLVGYNLTNTIPFMAGWPDWGRIVAGVVLGLILAGLAAVLVRLAGALVGFAVGWSLATWILPQFGILSGSNPFTIWSLVIAAVCALLVLIFFDWGIIVLSSIYGAFNFLWGLSYYVSLGSTAFWVILAGLAVIGLFVQGAQLSGYRRK